MDEYNESLELIENVFYYLFQYEMNQLFVRPNQNSIFYQMISYSYYYFTAGDVNRDQSSALGFFFFSFMVKCSSKCSICSIEERNRF